MTAEDTLGQVRCPYDFLVAIDLESTCDENHSNPSEAKVRRDQGEIIELSFAVIDVALKEIVHRQQIFVRPEKTVLTPFCTTLTGITSAQLDAAEPLKYALKTVDTFIQSKIISLQKKFCFVTHGIPLPHYYNVFYDVIREVNHWLLISGHRTASPKTSINGLCNVINLAHEGRPHSGMDDANNIARISVAVLESLEKWAQTAEALTGRESCALNEFYATLSKVVHFGGLPFKATITEMEDWVNLAGVKAKELWMVRNAEGRADGTGFAVFLSHEEAKQCLSLHGRLLGERTILVSPRYRVANSANFRSQGSFPTAEEIAAATPAAEMKPGDWLCTSCQYHNFASRRNCFKCQAPHPHVVKQTATANAAQPMKPGDWNCPNISCKFQNFASRFECMRCRTRKPPVGGYGPSGHFKTGVSNKILPGDWNCAQCRLNNFASRSRCMQCGSPQYQAAGPASGPRTRPTDRPGDWNCPNDTCRYHNYASRSECHRCGSKRADGHYPVHPLTGQTSHPHVKPKDWVCPSQSCRYNNFGKRETCALCNAPNPTPKLEADELSSQVSGEDASNHTLSVLQSTQQPVPTQNPLPTAQPQLAQQNMPISMNGGYRNAGVGGQPGPAGYYSGFTAQQHHQMQIQGMHPGLALGHNHGQLTHGHGTQQAQQSQLPYEGSLFAQGHEYAAYGYNQYGYTGHQQAPSNYGSYQ
ncbi:hypothetical protein BC829DRAFT_379452 [Chytridium lagenaria]|nr:hypothetical protein BC829DRAFT_379452 [Chytridium lagenaria]